MEELLTAINGDKEYFENLKKTFINPIILLTKGGFLEAAYLAYKETVIQLVNQYNKDLMKTAPMEAK